MRDQFPEFTARNARVVTIAMGLPAMAENFRQEHRIPFEVLIDRTRESYRALGLRRGTFGEFFGLRALPRVLALLLSGKARPPAKGQDVYQRGGALVVAPGGAVRYVHRARRADDNAPTEALLKAVQA